MEQQVKKKKRQVINICLFNTSITDYKELEHQISLILLNVAKQFLGEDKKIYILDLFKIVFGKDYDINNYESYYLLDRLNICIKGLRARDEVFFIKNGGNVYVLKTMDEGRKYINKNNVEIENIRKANTRCIAWVLNEKWRNLK